MRNNTSSLSILIADEHPLVRKSLRRLLNTEADIEVVGEAQNAKQALELARELEPDLIILDIAMREKDGWSVLGELAQWPRRPQVIVCSMWLQFNTVALAAGASAFIDKVRAGQTLIPTIRSLADPMQA